MVCYAKQQAAAAREHALETQIKRFGKGYQRRLRKLVKVSSRLGDVLYAFPAAAFALVSGRADHARRGEAVRMIKDGASLKLVAKTLDLPVWTRRLPPEAFETPLGVLPDGEAFARSVANHVPKDAEATAMWLRWVMAGHEGCDENFALWLARQRIYRADINVGTPVLPLATYAWFSKHCDEQRARRLVQRPWHKGVTLASAVDSMGTWFTRMLLDVTRADQTRGPGRYSGRKRHRLISFVQLRTPAELQEEGDAMDHCVGSYAAEVARGNCVIYSVRKAGQRVATMEIRWVYGHNRPPIVNQLRGYANAVVTDEVRKAVAEWMKGQDAFMFDSPHMIGNLPIDETRWRAIWTDYIAQKGSCVVPERPSGQLLQSLSRDVAMLSRYAHRG